MNIGILHPGEMGISVAASAINSGNRVLWLSQNRSLKTRARAEQFGLIEVKSLEAMNAECEVIISICPPHAAEEVANAVAKLNFSGIYLDANAIAPARARKIGNVIQNAGGKFVDGGIIGGPAWQPNSTRLYLSGDKAELLALIFNSGPLETEIVGVDIGKASALKMCYAAYSKGTTALLTSILALAEANNVRELLCEQWNMDEAGFSQDVEQRARRVTSKAWRFQGEMMEIADTFEEVGLPRGFHESAGEVYKRLAKFKDEPAIPEVMNVLKALAK